MKALRFIVLAALTTLGFTAYAGSPSVLLDENFQSFKDQGWTNDTVCGAKKVDSHADFNVTKTYGKNKVTFYFKHAAVTPKCPAKKSPTKVSNGYVEINKKPGSELSITQMPFISTITVEASATGDVRGYALMKSIKGGPWVKVGEYIGAKANGSDAQYGFTDTITINEGDVALKFVPTVCGKDEPELQTFRIHGIKIMGK